MTPTDTPAPTASEIREVAEAGLRGEVIKGDDSWFDKLLDWGFQDERTALVYALFYEAVVGRCWHRDLYEERADGASDIMPDIMHEGSCEQQSATCEKPCSACRALAAHRVRS